MPKPQSKSQSKDKQPKKLLEVKPKKEVKKPSPAKAAPKKDAKPPKAAEKLVG